MKKSFSLFLIVAILLAACGSALTTEKPVTEAVKQVTTTEAATQVTTTEAATQVTTAESVTQVTTTEATTQVTTTEATTQVTTTEATTQVTTIETTTPDTIIEAAQANDDHIQDYVANTNTHKFHYPDCSSVRDIKDSNKWYFTGDRQELIDSGYDPCGRCHP